MDLDDAVNLFAIARPGRERPPAMARDCSARDGITLERNRAALDRTEPWYRVLSGCSRIADIDRGLLAR